MNFIWAASVIQEMQFKVLYNKEFTYAKCFTLKLHIK